MLFATITCSGFLHIRLKSQYPIEATVTVRKQDNVTYIVVPIEILPGSTKKLGPFPIEFNENYTLAIDGGRVEPLGINGSMYTSYFKPVRGTLSPEQIYLPLNGLQLLFECDKERSGSKCDVRCSDNCKAGSVNQTTTVSIDYSIDLTKLPKIVRRLKETTKVENEIKREEIESKNEDNRKDVLGSTKPMGAPKSIFLDLFNNILNLRKTVHEKSNDEIPYGIDRDMRGNSESDEQTPWTMIRKMNAHRRDDNEEKTKNIERHSTIQKTFGLRHQTPNRFTGLEGPGKGMGMLQLFQPLMGMMPRITGGFTDSTGGDDFSLDQILRN